MIIGNGFDIADGNPTKYSEFLNSYMQEVYCKFDNSGQFHDKLLNFKIQQGFNIDLKKASTINIYKGLQEHSIEWNAKPFLDYLLKIESELNWVDIEIAYYDSLIKLIRNHGNIPDNKSRIELSRKITKLNDSLDAIKEELINYLDKKIEKNKAINQNILEHFKVIAEDISNSNGEVLVCNFNYTEFVNKYIREISNYGFYKQSSSFKLIHIHGKINSNSNPIIFGYGDEFGEFQMIKDLQIDCALDKFKSYEYVMADNMESLLDYINTHDYMLHIMGHSCGQSDKVILKDIIDNQRCKEIRIYYYQYLTSINGLVENDFKQKVQNISRLFSQSAQKEITSKIQFNKNVPLVPSKP